LSVPPGRYTLSAFPEYRYRPGRDPHPVRDPRGHSFDAPAQSGLFEPERWAECDAYLYAIDLWNDGYYWEVHEVLEDLWRGVRTRRDVSALLKGLIQSAAALLKQALGEPRGASRLAARGAAALRTAGPGSLGFDPLALADRVESFVSGRCTEAPKIVLEGVPCVAESSAARRSH
jgi:hypothetical protein